VTPVTSARFAIEMAELYGADPRTVKALWRRDAAY
jgi:hypothetical protein